MNREGREGRERREVEGGWFLSYNGGAKPVPNDTHLTKKNFSLRNALQSLKKNYCHNSPVIFAFASTKMQNLVILFPAFVCIKYVTTNY